MLLGGQLAILRYLKLAWLQLYFSVCKLAGSVLYVADCIVEQPFVLSFEHQSSVWLPASCTIQPQVTSQNTYVRIQQYNKVLALCAGKDNHCQ